jgi:SAM-dependent methyltransferase
MTETLLPWATRPGLLVLRKSRELPLGVLVPTHSGDRVLPPSLHARQGTLVRLVAPGHHLFQVTVLGFDDVVGRGALQGKIARATKLPACHCLRHSLVPLIKCPAQPRGADNNQGKCDSDSCASPIVLVSATIPVRALHRESYIRGASPLRLATMVPAGDFDYELHGIGYSSERRPDPTIAALVREGLGPATSVVNVGAGAGSYEPTDLDVTAVEPSAAMRAQRPKDCAPAINAVAEALPFADDTFDAAMASVTVHQWKDQDQGLRELRRVSRGPVVILTFDGDELDRFWLAHYAPELVNAERHRYPAINHVCQVLGGLATVTAVPIPLDCPDGFTEAFYGRPEQFLRPEVRRSQSAWGFVSPEAEQRTVDRLRDDLDSGEWDRRYGPFRSQATFIGSLRLIVYRR